MGRFQALPSQNEVAEMKEDLAFKEGEMKKSEFTSVGLASGRPYTIMNTGNVRVHFLSDWFRVSLNKK